MKKIVLPDFIISSLHSTFGKSTKKTCSATLNGNNKTLYHSIDVHCEA